MSQWENIEAIEQRLWKSADTLRANSEYASNEYFMPLMGLIFLRHAYSRYLMVRDEIITSLPKRSGKTRELSKEDFSNKRAIFLRPEAQFHYLVNLPEEADRATALLNAMESIENDYDSLKGVLPKNEYQKIKNDILLHLLTIFNDPALASSKGDVFGRIYEYFLTQFADQKAHDGGEFFTPVSLVQMIVNVIEPKKGKIIDPACGSGGMFVQSAHFIERQAKNPSEEVTFYGLEKNPTTIKLGKMNLAVHGLEGIIEPAITYYDDPLDFLGKANYVMANPPFNVDEVSADNIKTDPRLPFGLPGVNDKKKVSNANYLWIQYFYSYLNEKGRAGFVMSSQSSSAGRGEQKVRQQLIETGHVDVMIGIGSGFFYTRPVPCELWFFDKAKPKAHQDKVLMIDARNISRKVTRTINDFSPEQMQNLSSIVWLYRGEYDRFWTLVQKYLKQAIAEMKGIPTKLSPFLQEFRESLSLMKTYLKNSKQKPSDEFQKLESQFLSLFDDFIAFEQALKELAGVDLPSNSQNSIIQTYQGLAPEFNRCRLFESSAEALFRSISKQCNQFETKSDDTSLFPERLKSRSKNSLFKHLELSQSDALSQIRQACYCFEQANWLLEYFPEGKLRDIEGLVKLVDIHEIKINDWSLTPGRYVGVDQGDLGVEINFKDVLKEIHNELKNLHDHSIVLINTIEKNLEGLML
jgi:type I restriction enzyme M protein